MSQGGAQTVEGINDEKDFDQLMDALTSLGLSVEDQVRFDSSRTIYFVP